jgi:hypothetical protein
MLYPPANVRGEKGPSDPVGMILFHLGWLYESGNGVTKDYGKAREW